METAQNEIVCNTESNSTVSHSNVTDANVLSKEKEEELLFDKEEAGEDEDVLSDDSLRLKLSDDEDVEQEERIAGRTNISELKPQSKGTEQQLTGVIAEEKSHSKPQEVVEQVIESGGKKATQEKHNSAVAVAENSTLPSDDYASENKPTQNDRCDSESSTVTAIECNEKHILNMPDRIQNDCHGKEISNIVGNIKNESQLTRNHDKSIAEDEILSDDSKREGNELKNISEIGEVNDACTSATSEQHISENDNSPTSNRIKLNSYRNADLITYIEDNLKEIVSVYDETNSANSCKLNNLDTIDNDNPLIDSVSVNTDNNELSSTSTIVSNNCDDDDLTILTDEVVDKVTIYDMKYLKKILIEENRNKNSGDVNNICREYKEKNIKHEDVTQKNKGIEKTRSIQQETNIALVQNQDNDLSSVEGKTEIMNEDHNFNKSVGQVVHNNSLSVLLKDALLTPIVKDANNKNKTEFTGAIVQRRKRLRKSATLDIIDAEQDCATEEDKQEEKECGRQKRRTARNAEEIIRKKYLNSDSDSNDSGEQYIPLAHKLNQDSRSASPSLKRNCPSNESHVPNGVVKKIKMSIKSEEKSATSDITKLSFVEKFFQRDIKDKLQKFTQGELEELLIQKIVETITMRSEIGQLREQARMSEKHQETTRTKLQQLIKQVKDFEMVLARNEVERRASSDKFVPPVKVNRSVGLQVNFITEHGVQNLRQMQQSLHVRSANVPSNISSPAPEANVNTPNPRRGIKIRSPRRTEPPLIAPAPAISQSSVQTTTLMSTVTPAALVVAKPLESQQTVTLPSQASNVQQLLPAPQQQIQSQPHQAIVLNGKIQNQVNRSATTLIATKQKNNDLIDLTDEEEKSKSSIKVTSVPTTSMLDQLSGTSKPGQCFQRVIQTIPANVAITQPASIRLVQPNQSTPTALVNNMNQPRLTYLMQSGVGTTRQLLITSNASQIRPITTCRPSLPTVTYKTGNSTIANGTVRVLSTSAVSNVQVTKHPAPLPDIPSYTMNPGWKLPPPAPSLKISKVANGIVLSWNMTLTDKYADIASYQLYAYQEVAGVNPSTSLWKKVGDVRALPLPMACTLTQFSEGNNYYFAVRAVDTHSRKGQYSIPGNISL